MVTFHIYLVVFKSARQLPSSFMARMKAWCTQFINYLILPSDIQSKPFVHPADSNWSIFLSYFPL